MASDDAANTETNDGWLDQTASALNLKSRLAIVTQEVADIGIWNLDSAERVKTLRGHTAGVQSLLYSGQRATGERFRRSHDQGVASSSAFKH